MSELDKQVQEYIERIQESLEYGAYETASLIASNLSTFLMKVHKGNIRYCTECERVEEK